MKALFGTLASQAAVMSLAIFRLMERRQPKFHGERASQPGTPAKIEHMTSRHWRSRERGPRPAWSYRGARRNALKNARPR